MYFMQTEIKKFRASIIILENIEFKTKTAGRDTEGHNMMIQ